MNSLPVPDKYHELASLTGLRVFAALAVYLSHVGPPIGATLALATFLYAGYYGVTFFFVLSGFVLAHNYFESLSRPTGRGLWSFAIARLARVYPLYLLVLLYLSAPSMTAGTLNSQLWLEHAIAAQAWDPSVDFAYAFNAPAWSIGVEFFLYATMPLTVLLFARIDRSIRWLVVAIAVTIAVMAAVVVWFSISGRADLPRTDADSAHRWLYRNPLPRLGDFVLGLLAARLYLRLRGWSRRGLAGSVLIVTALIATVAIASTPALLFSALSWDLSYAVPALALILGLALAPRHAIARFLSLPAIFLLGEASYAFYLIHYPMLQLLGSPQWNKSLNVPTLFFEFATLMLILAAAVGLHLLVERPTKRAIRQTLGALPHGLLRWRSAASDAHPSTVTSDPAGSSSSLADGSPR